MATWTWLSHILSEDAPVYGNSGRLEIILGKQIACGDSCNTLKLLLPNHTGSHVDAPKHFIDGGMSVDQYQPEDWIFNKPILLELGIIEPRIISIDDVLSALDKSVVDADLILFRTGIEAYRTEERFWKSPPGFSPELAEFICERFPSCAAIGMDAISISSFAHREIGREAHLAFLSKGIRIFEDLALASIERPKSLQRVFALPLRVTSADGCPVTLIGEFD